MTDLWDLLKYHNHDPNAILLRGLRCTQKLPYTERIILLFYMNIYFNKEPNIQE